MVCGPAANG